MKLYRNAIILALILALLAGAYIAMKGRKGTSEDNTTTPGVSDNIKIFNLETDKITEITVENKELGKLVFVKKDKAWVASSPADFKVSSSRIDSIAFEMAIFDADKVIEENATDLAQYGLDKPVTVSIKMDNGDIKAVEIGNETPSKSGYYMKTKDSNKIYSINSYKTGTLMAKYSEIRDTLLYSVKAADVTAFALKKAGNTVFRTKKVGDTEWALTEPIDANAELGSLGTIVEKVATLTAKEFVEKNPADLGKYGLTNPSYSFEITTLGGTKTVLLGNEKVKGSEIYAKMADSSEVFVLDEASVGFVDKPLKEMIEIFAYIVNIKDVNKIVVEMDGKTVTSEIQTDTGGDSDKDKFLVNGKDATVKNENGDQLFRKYYQALIGITMSDLEIGAKPTGAPEITFTYYLKKNPGKVTVEFIPKNDKFYYVVKNGKYSNIIVAKSKFDETEGVRNTYKNLVEAMEKANKK